jgi:hypothetical protein
MSREIAVPGSATIKADAWAAQLVREGWAPGDARARSLACYGLAPETRAPEPSISAAFLRRLRDELAASRPAAENGYEYRAAAGKRESRARIANGVRMRGSAS